MTDDMAKRQLQRMMKSFTQGSILHLLGELFEEMAEVARLDGEDVRREQCASVAKTLFVLGLGIDSACPR